MKRSWRFPRQRAFRFRLSHPKMFFGPGGLPRFGVNTPLPHSAPNAATSPFYKSPYFPCFFLRDPAWTPDSRSRCVSRRTGVIGPNQSIRLSTGRHLL